MQTNTRNEIEVYSEETIISYRNWLLQILKSRRNEGFWTARRII